MHRYPILAYSSLLLLAAFIAWDTYDPATDGIGPAGCIMCGRGLLKIVIAVLAAVIGAGGLATRARSERVAFR